MRKLTTKFCGDSTHTTNTACGFSELSKAKDNFFYSKGIIPCDHSQQYLLAI